MPSATDLGAILTAMVTPFDSHGALREDAAPPRASSRRARLGRSGRGRHDRRGPHPDDAEKLRLFETVVDEVGESATVVAGTGSNDTAHSVHLTRQASEVVWTPCSS